MKLKFSLVYNRKKTFNAGGYAGIWIRARHKNRYKYITTKIFIKENQWDGNNKIINSNNPNYKVLNARLEKKLQFFEDLQTKYLLQDVKFDLNTFDEVLDREDCSSFIKFMELELEKERVNKKGTIGAHRNSINKFKAFAGDVSFQNLNYSLLKDFENELRKNGYKPNTVHKHFKNLKIYGYKAEKQELINPSKNPFRDFKVFQQQTERTFLTLDELNNLEELEFPLEEKMLEYTRDLFCFSCYTGLRWSDVTRITSKHLFKNNNRYYINNLIMQKASPGIRKEIYIPLYQLFCNSEGLSKPELLIEKYYKNNEEPIFAALSDSHVNRYLKILAERVGLDKLLTFHCSRVSFASITLNFFNVPIDIVRRILGHSKIETTQKYLKADNKLIHQSLQFTDWKRSSSLQKDAEMY